MRSVIDQGLENTGWLEERCESPATLYYALRNLDMDEVSRVTHVSLEQISQAARLYGEADAGAIVYALEQRRGGPTRGLRPGVNRPGPDHRQRRQTRGGTLPDAARGRTSKGLGTSAVSPTGFQGTGRLRTLTPAARLKQPGAAAFRRNRACAYPACWTPQGTDESRP